MSDEAVVEAQKQQEGADSAPALELDSFEDALSERFKPRTEDARSEINQAVQVLAQQALEGRIIEQDAVNTIKGLIAALDEKISTQVNKIIHHPSFQELESAWRGLNHLVTNTETSTDLKIRVLPIKKKELINTFKRFPGTAWDQSPLFKKIYGEEYDQLGGEPYACFVGDYYFDHGPQDVFVLEAMSKICASAHAPFITAASPALLQMDEWSELSKPADLAKVVTTPEYATWNAFRSSEDSRYVCLTLPRFLSRLPYSIKDNPVEGFDFEERVSGDNANDFCWANAAYAMAVNINQAFKEYGWCTRIRGAESGGTVSGLPVYTFPSDEGGVDMTCPTEIAIGERREMELSNLGLMGLVHRKNTESAVFMGAQTTNLPQEYDDPVATANAKLSARLPYIFAACRFSHYLKVMVRDKIGQTMEKDELRQYLWDWIRQYVCPDPQNANEHVKAKKPLAEAQVIVEDLPENPGFYKATFHVRPHYQLEGMTVSMRLVSKLPSLA